MGYFSPGPSPNSSSTESLLTSPTLDSVSVVLANTEYSYVLPTGVKFFRLRPRGVSILKLSFTSGMSGTSYTEISPGFQYESPPFPITASLTLYFQGNKASEVVEIESWL